MASLNFDNVSDESLKGIVLTAKILIVPFIGLRIWVGIRGNGGRRISWSDGMVLLCFVLNIAHAILHFKMIERHSDYGPFPERLISRILKTLFLVNLLYLLVIWTAKAAIVLLYFEMTARVSAQLPRRQLQFLYATAAIGFLSFAVSILATFLPCTPINRMWRDPRNPSSGFCSPLNPTNVYATFVCSIVADLGLLLFPICLIRVSALSNRSRAAVFLVIGIGSISIVGGVLRFALVSKALLTLVPTSTNPGTSGGWIGVWTSIEIFFAQIVICLPSVRTAIRIWRARGAEKELFGDAMRLGSRDGGVSRMAETRTDVEDVEKHRG